MTEPGVGTNRYAYSFNDPINLRDPGGNATYLDDGSDPQRRGEYTINEKGDITLVDKGGNRITVRGAGPNAEQLENYSVEQWDSVRQRINMTVDRRSRLDHGGAMTFDVRPKGLDIVAHIKGVHSSGRGLARCAANCERGYGILAELAGDPSTASLLADALLQAVAKNPEYAAGRFTPGFLASVATTAASKRPSLGLAVGTSVNMSAIAGDLGFFANAADKFGLSLTNQQIRSIIGYGLKQ